MTAEEKTLLVKIESKVTELVEWKNNVSALLYGTSRGDFGYFHKSNILWRILILWPLMIGSIGIGATLTFLIQYALRK